MKLFRWQISKKITGIQKALMSVHHIDEYDVVTKNIWCHRFTRISRASKTRDLFWFDDNSIGGLERLYVDSREIDRIEYETIRKGIYASRVFFKNFHKMPRGFGSTEDALTLIVRLERARANGRRANR